MSARTTSPLLYFSAYAALYIIWGSTYLAIRFTVETIPPFLSGSLRFFLAGGILLVWCLYREQERPTLRGFLAALKVAGIMLLGGYGGVVWAQQTVPSSMAALIISIEPLWFVIFDWLFFKSRKPSTAEALGVALGHFVLADPAAFFAPLTVGTTNLPIAVGLILVGLVTVPVELRTGSWIGFQSAYSLSVAGSLVGVRDVRIWGALVGTLVAARAVYVLPIISTAADVPTVVGELFTMLGLAPLAWFGVGTVLRIAQDDEPVRSE